MTPVEILPLQDTLVLRARGSELIILPHHIKQLKSESDLRKFSVYFHKEALLNRSARKLFEAWLRKDSSLWKRIFHSVHEEMKDTKQSDETPTKKKKKIVDEKVEKKDKKAASEIETMPATAPQVKDGRKIATRKPSPTSVTPTKTPAAPSKAAKSGKSRGRG